MTPSKFPWWCFGVIVACQAEAPKQDGGALGLDCSVYADTLLQYAGSSGDSEFQLGEGALGSPDGDVVEVRTNDVLTVLFGGLGGVINRPGNDVQVHHQSDGEYSVAVYAGDAADNFVYTGQLLTGQETFLNLTTSGVNIARVWRFVGVEGVFALDAVQSVSTLCDEL